MYRNFHHLAAFLSSSTFRIPWYLVVLMYLRGWGCDITNLSNIVQTTAEEAIAKIDQGLYNYRRRVILDWWKTGIYSARILPTLFGGAEEVPIIGGGVSFGNENHI